MIRKGDIVKFREVKEKGDEDLRFVVLAFVYAKSEFVFAEETVRAIIQSVMSPMMFSEACDC